MEMKKIGTFVIQESFNITNRGIVILGHSPDTIVKPGLYVTLLINETPNTYRITGIEHGKNLDVDYLQVGLLLSIPDPKQLDFIAQNKILNKTVDIINPE
jgi:hypothetical protein